MGLLFETFCRTFLAGIILLLHEPFRLGNQIKVDEFEATVEAIESLATIIKTYDSRQIGIPDSEAVSAAYESRLSSMS